MSIEQENKDNFVQERLDSLYEIDCKIVSLLDNMSSLFQTYSTPKSSDNDLSEQKEQLKAQTKTIYNTISNVAIGLRKEVKIMDENIGVYNKNKDGVMILPISVDQKNTTLGKTKLKDEIRELSTIVSGEKDKLNDGKQEAIPKKETNTESLEKEKQDNIIDIETKKEPNENEDEDFDMIA
ncbi:Mediator of RNA polymerase II transcription subunit 11 [Debaryomyces fabryi]|uniref:Mediator of RNA polymerase II transcription subunit 11 n=1 Tax=Debaryomyces fabryi TaxID=58627 RepID=A0A0V1Q4W6_9ASCO|nr:Mediator of RNA polymerase II transcription subunit 11 [Debaryomyces fabryi]KSA03452.1 Mediator of RNA polymerase II transcription subunit 11 [Debaryomyces fabryi]CUM53691.1 unnamed protein product [Debaryomyces fabryi]